MPRFRFPPITLTFLLLAATGAIAMRAEELSPEAVPAKHPMITYEGRYAVDAGGAVRMGFPGVTAHLRFRGQKLVLRARASADGVGLDVRIDGAAPVLVRLRQGEDDYELLPSGASTQHAVSVLRRNESWQGTCDLVAFDPGVGGAWLPPPTLPRRRLMFIGDSVTSGELAAYVPGTDFHDRANSNAGRSYGMVLARRLGAQCHLVSYGGRGVIRDWEGRRDTRNAPQFYPLALPDEPALAWDPARYVPDAVGIGLGTNDFNPGVPEQEEFVAAYVALIRRVRHDAPDALIFVMDSPIVTDNAEKGPRRTALHGYLEQVVARAADARVILAPLPTYPGVPGNGHPTGADHLAMAKELEPVVRQALGW